jgi:hypothetical protein
MLAFSRKKYVDIVLLVSKQMCKLYSQHIVENEYHLLYIDLIGSDLKSKCLYKFAWQIVQNFNLKITLSITLKYDKQDQQGKATFNERNPPPPPTWPSTKNQWQGAQADPKPAGGK